MVKKGFSLLPVHFEFCIVLRIDNSHSTVWEDGVHNEWFRPTSLQLPRENVKSRVVQRNLISRGKVFPVYDLVMKKFSPAFGDPSVLVGFIPYLL